MFLFPGEVAKEAAFQGGGLIYLESYRPCVRTGTDENGKLKKVRPAVNCKKDCPHCGWNPNEQKRRLEKGKFVNDAVVVIRHYADEKDLEGIPVVYSGLYHLVFPRSKLNRGKHGR